jgi:hypothetical protein
MVGDSADMGARIRAILPASWFGDDAPVLSALLQGVGSCWSCIYGLIQFVVTQARISTAQGEFLDLISADFFGSQLPRLGLEQDSAYLVRIKNELLRPRATRASLALALTQLTGRAPVIFEPSLASDTGGYCLGGVGYTVAGGWGNLELPFQAFVTAYRPMESGIALLAGYGSGGVPVYGNPSMQPVQILDVNIYAEIASVLPAGTVAWTRISD